MFTVKQCTCPGCGAPLSTDARTCEYCKSSIIMDTPAMDLSAYDRSISRYSFGWTDYRTLYGSPS